MIGERTSEGFEVRLRTRDPGRYIGAAFLAFWLCGWAVGEGFVLWILAKCAWALLTGTPPDPGRQPLTAGPALMVGGFLLFWLAVWTIGGIGAIGELLRLLWGEDRIVVSSGRLTVTWSRGPLRTKRSFERDAIRRISLLAPRNHLALESGTQRIELSRLGTPAERQEAAAVLCAELALPDADVNAATLPDRWDEVVTPEGERALVPNLSVRRKQARVGLVLAMVAAAITFFAARGIGHDLRLIAPAMVALVMTCLLTAGVVWLARGRMEWRIGSGRLTLRKRFGADVQDVFEARRLLLDSSTDSDGDVWYELYALGDPNDPNAPAMPAWRPTRPKNSRTVIRLMNDASVPRDLAAWLTRETGLALEDRTTPQAQAVDFAKLRELLEGSGKFGQWAAKWVDRLGDGRGAPSK
jgi:hypothetical protein